jgi:magnesium transporter
VAIDNTVFAGTLDPMIIPTKSPKGVPMISCLTKRTRTNTDSQLDEKYTDNKELEEKPQSSPRPRFVAPYLTISLAYHRTKRFISNIWKSCAWRTKTEPPTTPTMTPSPSQVTFRRIGSTRKLVTSLVRLLATKSDVLTAFRKRLLRASTLKPKSMTARSSEELAIYSGDIQG